MDSQIKVKGCLRRGGVSGPCVTGASYSGPLLEGAPLVLSARVRWIFCFRGAEQKWPSLHLQGASLREPLPSCEPRFHLRRGSLPFSPRKGKRKGKLANAGRRGKETRLLPEVLLEVLFGAVGSGGGRDGTYRKSGSPFEPKGSPYRIYLTPFSLF